jgi:hypothetical protein
MWALPAFTNFERMVAKSPYYYCGFIKKKIFLLMLSSMEFKRVL